MGPAKVVLLACGSFNPPTYMHLRMFEIARDHLHRLGQCQVIGGLISPVHDSYGKKDLAFSTHRCNLVKLALQDSDWIHLSDWECMQQGWTTTVQVLQYHQNIINSYINYDDEVDSEKILNENDRPGWVSNIMKHCKRGTGGVLVKLLCGGDLLESFGTPGLWKETDIESIVGDNGLIAITRSGTNPYKFIYESDVLTKWQSKIVVVPEWITNEVSSTKIRRSLRRGESVKYLMPSPVIDYIKSNGLYGPLDK